MTRREAIKRMGLTLAGGLLASGGLSALASCTKEKKRIILYFTGTGNCLYTVRQLADKGTELLSIPQMVKEGRYDFDADEIGLVYPIYGHMPPHRLPEKEREILRRHGCVRAVRHLYGGVSARQLASRGAGRKHRRRLRVLLRVHTELPAESHPVCEGQQRPAAGPRRSES